MKKECIYCKKIFFSPIKKVKVCGNKECKNKSFREYYHKHKKQLNENSRAYYYKNIEQRRKHGREYYKKNREIILEKNLKYKKENRDKYNKINRDYCKRKPEVHREGNKKCYLKHRDKRLKSHKNYYQDNKEKCKKSTQRWLNNNQESYSKYQENWFKEKREKENKKREKLGLPKIGEGNSRENELFMIIKEIYPFHEIKRNTRRMLGYRLELDIFIPSLKLAFEYNGKQHYDQKVFNLINRNTNKFEEQVYRDKIKKKICKIKGINLVIIKYSEKLSKEVIISKLNKMKINTTNGRPINTPISL